MNREKTIELAKEADLINEHNLDLLEDKIVIEQLAASQAQIKVLRDALIHLTHNAKKSGANMGLALDISAKALAAPTDTTALRELLKAERERCAQVLDARAIRNENAAQDCIRHGEPDEVSSLRSAAWQLSCCAERIRAMEDES